MLHVSKPSMAACIVPALGMQGKRLDAERADLIAELEATLTPDVAHQVEAMLEHHTRRPSIISHVSPSRSSSSTSLVPPSRSSSSTSILPAAEKIQPSALPSVADRHSEEGDGVLDNEFDCVVP